MTKLCIKTINEHIHEYRTHMLNAKYQELNLSDKRIYEKLTRLRLDIDSRSNTYYFLVEKDFNVDELKVSFVNKGEGVTVPCKSEEDVIAFLISYEIIVKVVPDTKDINIEDFFL